MAKFFHQIKLLTHKNLRVRFSHSCLLFCELFIPFFITAIIGLLTSYETSGREGSSYSPTSNINDISPEDKFKCQDGAQVVSHEDPSWIPGYPAYQCEDLYYFINRPEITTLVMDLRIHYVIADKILQKGNLPLAEAVLASVLRGGSKNESTKWEKSTQSEKELEICIAQSHPDCQDIFAVIIISKIEDAVKTDNKFTVEYTIRMTDSEEITDRLFAMFQPDYFNAALSSATRMYFGYPGTWPSEFPFKGFVQIQSLMDQGIMNYIKDKYGPGKSEEVKVSLVRMPHIQPIGDRSEEISKFISLLYSLLASLTIFSLMRVNSEKFSGFKELLRMHGISTGTQWMGWLFSSFVVYSIWTLMLTFLLAFPILGGENLLSILKINCILYWLLLLLFIMSITTFCYLISVFFERVWTAASIGLVTWILLTVFMMVTSAVSRSLRKWTVMALMLIPTVAFDYAFRLFINGGGTFRTMGTQVIEYLEVTTLHCLFMLLLDSCIFMTLTMYLDNVLPAKYGVRKPPLYFIRNCIKFIKKNTGAANGPGKYDEDLNQEDHVEMVSIIPEDSHSHQQPFQPDPEHVEAAVIIRNLKKEFRKNKKRAVDGLNAKMFTGEIYALLGFNGAGKTTTIGIMTGLTSPTDGVAHIFDLDIRKDMEEIRKYIGLCPQHNLLFDEMTVLQQVAFFGKLKGLENARYKAAELLMWLGMTDKLHNRPEELSGGQKRRVHLAIALIGDTKLAFLDEPTSGLDPETRREVWDILLKLRGKMTLILTTHDMEEADVLGDRIGIMSEGKMMCSGTPSFLKKHYGVGYNLKMSATNADCDPEKVFVVARNYVPNAKLNSDIISGQNASAPQNSISISLPTADLDLSKVADLLDALRLEQETLGIGDIGLSLSTMDEVFLKVGEAVQAVTVNINESCEPSTGNVSSSRYVGARLTWYRFNWLMHKRMLYFSSAPFAILFLVLSFSAILWLALTTLSVAVSNSKDIEPPRSVSSSSMSAYLDPVILLHENDHSDDPLLIDPEKRNKAISFAVSYLSRLHESTVNLKSSMQVKEYPKEITFRQMMRSLEKASVQDLHTYRQHYLVGASLNRTTEGDNSVTGFFSAYALHSAPLSLNLISQTLIKKMFGVDATIEVVNHPYSRAHNYDHISLALLSTSYQQLYYFVKSGGIAVLVVITSLLTATVALLPTEERLNKGKQLQTMTGASPFLYWMSFFTWDFIFFTMVNILITLIYILADYFSGNWIFTNNGAWAIIFLILECHSFAALWFCYLISWAPCIKTASDGFLIVNKFTVIVGILWNFTRHLLISMTLSDIRRGRTETFSHLVYYLSTWSGYVTWIVPSYNLFPAMMKLSTKSLSNSICNWFPEKVLELSCGAWDKEDQDTNQFMHRCCSNCKENCFKPQPYFSTDEIEIITHHLEAHSMIYDILILILSGFVNAGVLFSLEYLIPYMKAKKQLDTHSPTYSPENGPLSGASANTSQEEDVVNEAARVADIVKDNALETANHALICDNLQLKFKTLKAVKGLSFGVHRGECFGLLGTNGAGKTSTFRMITGDISPTCGNMFSGGLNYYKHRAPYLASLGYCPQFDGIIGSLTGLQMVKLYGALRGIPPERLQEDATIWLDRFGLLGSAKKKCMRYSGGMKRRLSAAMALIGNPKLLLLDEPTTGVDPAFRRQFWKVIREIRERGQSVLLTSHTMDECEALCTRLGIMVDGQFKCLGNIQHLKNKFGKGYILTLKPKRFPEEEDEEKQKLVDQLVLKMTNEFHPVRLQIKQKTLIQYQILNKSLWYSDIFRTMEQILGLPESNQLFEEYSVTETSLEDIFISFASSGNNNKNSLLSSLFP